MALEAAPHQQRADVALEFLSLQTADQGEREQGEHEMAHEAFPEIFVICTCPLKHGFRLS